MLTAIHPLWDDHVRKTQLSAPLTDRKCRASGNLQLLAIVHHFFPVSYCISFPGGVRSWILISWLGTQRRSVQEKGSSDVLLFRKTKAMMIFKLYINSTVLLNGPRYPLDTTGKGTTSPPKFFWDDWEWLTNAAGHGKH